MDFWCCCDINRYAIDNLLRYFNEVNCSQYKIVKKMSVAILILSKKVALQTGQGVAENGNFNFVASYFQFYERN